MKWQEVRQLLPHRWVVVEAIEARTENNERVIDSMQIVEVFADDWKPAWECYEQLHAKDKWREYFVLHTDRVELNIGIMDEFGRILGEEYE